jgi:hypothetical protein
MNKAHALRIFERFNSKLERLEASSFLHGPAMSEALFTRESGWTSEFAGPTDESTHAFVLTFRFFTLNNEETSLQNLVKAFEAIGSAELTSDYNALRHRFNEYLDASSPMAVEEERHLSNRDIYEIFVFGDMAHANNKVRVAQYEDLSRTPFFFHFHVLFTGIARNCVAILQNIRELNRQAIAAESSA